MSSTQSKKLITALLKNKWELGTKEDGYTWVYHGEKQYAVAVYDYAWYLYRLEWDNNGVMIEQGKMGRRQSQMIQRRIDKDSKGR